MKQRLIIGVALLFLAIGTALIMWLRSRSAEDIVLPLANEQIIEQVTSTPQDVSSTETTKIITHTDFSGVYEYVGVSTTKSDLEDAATAAKIVKEAQAVASSTDAIALTQDTDSDTIPDAEESRYGTDPNKKDTDGDTFTDADEIKNGYNPLGSGRCAVSTCIIK